jgi:hypothetical protein
MVQNGHVMARTGACIAQAGSTVYLFGGCPAVHDGAVEASAEDGPHDADLWALDVDALAWRLLHRHSEAGDRCVLPLMCDWHALAHVAACTCCAFQIWTWCPLALIEHSRCQSEAPKHDESNACSFSPELANPEPRHSAAMWHWAGSLFLFGGAARRNGMDCTFSDFWRFDLARLRWQPVTLRGAPILACCSTDCAVVVSNVNSKLAGGSCKPARSICSHAHRKTS